MDKKTKELIIDIGFFIQKSEQLPTIKEIKIKSPISGCKISSGHCRKNFHENTYRIDVYSTRAKYFLDSNGKYYDKITKEKFRKALIGEERPIENILKDLAHELAHTKHWAHNKQHKIYTEILYQKIIKEYMNRTALNQKIICVVQ